MDMIAVVHSAIVQRDHVGGEWRVLYRG